MSEKIPAASVTQQMIDGWKKQYGNVFKLSVEDKACFLKPPTRRTLGYASTVKDSFKYNELVIKDCWLAGDDEMLTNDDYFIAACGQLDKIIEIKQAEVVKL